MASGTDWRSVYLERYYSRATGWTDGTTDFHALCAAAYAAGGHGAALEIGPGPSNPTSRFLATLGQLHGLDVDPAALANDALTTARTYDGAGPFPYADESFGLCVSNYVVEHISNPLAHLREVRRVLQPGGAYVFRTPNRWHYVALASSLTPHWFHRFAANRLRALPADAHEPYPTVYAMNTRGRLRRLADNAGFRVETLRMVEKDPSYGLIARPVFLALTAYERIVNRWSFFAGVRANIFAVLRKLEDFR
jgi:SAM-dependent methyltransferase